MTQDFEKRLYVQNVDQWNRKLNKERFSDRKLDVKIINHGIVLPARKMEVGYAGGVCDNNLSRRQLNIVKISLTGRPLTKSFVDLS